MSAYRPDAIVGSIITLLVGVSGTIRRVPPKLFMTGAFEGQDEEALRSAVLDPEYQHRFDVRLGDRLRHGSTPISQTSSYRVMLEPVFIDVWSRLSTTVEHAERFEQRARIRMNVELAMQALMYRDNLRTDENGTETGLSSGLLVGPSGDVNGVEWTELGADWDALIHRGRINAAAIVSVDQPVN